MGILEVTGVASIFPFMELISEPDSISKSSWLTYIYDTAGFTSHKSMFISFGIGIIVLIGITNFFAIFTLWLQYNYAWSTAHDLCMRLLSSYLNRPYKYFLDKNSSELQTYIVSEVTSLISGVLIPIIELISRLLVSILIFGLLLYMDVMISLIMFFALGGSYMVIYLSRQEFLKKIGKHRIEMNVSRFKTLSELFSGIKTVKIYGQEPFFYKRFEKASKEFCELQPRYNLILAAPKYLLEFLAFGTILSITIYLYYDTGSIQSALPRLSLYAVAGYRLLPALQKAFAAAGKFKHNYSVFEKLYPELISNYGSGIDFEREEMKLPFHENITLCNIQFAYDNSDQVLIKSLDLTIPKGQTVAFIGSTGSGKTTLVDLLVGLHEIDHGTFNVDAQPIAEHNVRQWQKNISYVPQDVFLFDDTILKNIVFDHTDKEIDYDLLKHVTRIADIHDFIINELPEGFDTQIGERGVRLSGGQRQRLGLARALYRQPTILVLDEATSALDSITEKGIIESLNKLPEDTTTIIIAHRLSTVKHADCIYFLKNGEISAKGDYHSLLASNDVFKQMVELS